MRPWGQFDRLLERLPRHSHYKAALDDDEEYAGLALALQGAESPSRTSRNVPLTGYSDVVARLDNLFDVISALHENLVDYMSGRKSTRTKRVRAPRPETAQQRLRRAQKIATLNNLVEQLTGGR